MPKLSLAEIARKPTNFKTFLSALAMSGIADLLSGNSGYTVFLPADEAFERLDKDFFKEIMADDKAKHLKILLQNHIVKGKYDALDLEDMKELTTLNGGTLRLGEYDGVIYVDNAKIITEDIETKDGMIQIIDEVLVPNSMDN